MIMLRNSTSLRLAAATFLILPIAAAAEVPQCERPELVWETWRADVAARNAGIEFFELQGEERGALLRAYSCDSAGETCPPDHVMVFYCADNAKVLIAFVRQGCVTMAEDVAIEDYLGFVGDGVPC